MSAPLVSVVIPVKDGGRFLRAAIESVITTRYAPLEIVVVDGQSRDRSPEIAGSFEEVRLLHQRDRGLANAYNAGIEASRGELIAFHASDDLWTPDKLSVQVGYLLAHPEVEYTIARADFFLEPGHSPPPGFKRELLVGDHVARILETLVARRSAFDRVGHFDPSIAISVDVDWFCRANDRGVPMAILPEVLLRRRVHDANLSLQADAGGRHYNEELLSILKRSIGRKQASRRAGGSRPGSSG